LSRYKNFQGYFTSPRMQHTEDTGIEKMKSSIEFTLFPLAAAIRLQPGQSRFKDICQVPCLLAGKSRLQEKLAAEILHYNNFDFPQKLQIKFNLSKLHRIAFTKD